MKLIIGGAYQGKREFAMAQYGLTQEDIFTCSGCSIDFSRPCVDALEEFAFACVQAGEDPLEYMKAHKEEWADSILICQDIFCGVVPIDAQLRQWRQETGRMCQYLSAEAEQVSRVFCGLEQRLK